MEREGLVGRTRGLVGFAMITAVLIDFAAFYYTVLSASGVGLRLPAGRFVSQ